MVLHEGDSFTEAVTRATDPETPQPPIEYQPLDRVRKYLGDVAWYGGDLTPFSDTTQLRRAARAAEDWEQITAHQPSLFN